MYLIKISLYHTLSNYQGNIIQLLILIVISFFLVRTWGENELLRSFEHLGNCIEQ